MAINVRLAADSAGTVLKKYGKTDLSDSSPEAADGDTCNEAKVGKLSRDLHQQIDHFGQRRDLLWKIVRSDM